MAAFRKGDNPIKAPAAQKTGGFANINVDKFRSNVMKEMKEEVANKEEMKQEQQPAANNNKAMTIGAPGGLGFFNKMRDTTES
jgi:hypothetical protein